MGIRVLETVTYDGEQYTAVMKKGCAGCVHSYSDPTCDAFGMRFGCGPTNRQNLGNGFTSVIWLKADDAAKAAVLGRLP